MVPFSPMTSIFRTNFRQKCFPISSLYGGSIDSLPRTSFSTKADGSPQAPSFSPDSFTQTPRAKYGSLVGSIKTTLRSDVVNLLEGCDLSLEDIKTVYNASYTPVSILVKFPSSSSYDKAMRLIMKNRLYRLDKVERFQWDKVKDYGAKTLLLQGIPRLAQLHEVECFLSGCDYDAANLLMLTRQAVPEPIKMAVVPVSSTIQATSVFLTKNRGYIGVSSSSSRVEARSGKCSCLCPIGVGASHVSALQ